MKIEEPLKILFVPIEGVGHVNACMGMGKPLLKRGHDVAFYVESAFKGKLSENGFKEYLYTAPLKPEDEEQKRKKKFKNPGDFLANMLLEKGIIGGSHPLKQIDIMTGQFSGEKKHNDLRNIVYNQELKKVIKDFNPDIFIVDHMMLDPAIYYSNKPWIKYMSVVPLFHLFEIQELPPCWSGLGINSDRNEWKKYRDLMVKFHYNQDFNDSVEKLGYERYPKDCLLPRTQSLSVYAFPEEYDYPQIKKYYPDWFNLEVFNKNTEQNTINLNEFLPENFYNDNLDNKFTGKWIYVSMGSMGSVDLDLMNRLINILSKTNHKFIISKGPRHNEYDLSDFRNIWGDRYLPQTKILPLMDLVITHGGNNSVTETFAQGIPMIIMPLFADQHDNAQRLFETNWALKLDPYKFTEEQLLESMETLLNNEQLKFKLKQASNRIRNSNRHEILCDKIEQIVANKKNLN